MIKNANETRYNWLCLKNPELMYECESVIKKIIETGVTLLEFNIVLNDRIEEQIFIDFIKNNGYEIKVINQSNITNEYDVIISIL